MVDRNHSPRVKIIVTDKKQEIIILFLNICKKKNYHTITSLRVEKRVLTLNSIFLNRKWKFNDQLMKQEETYELLEI